MWHAAPLVYDMEHDMMELRPLNATNWPADLPHSYTQVIAEAPPMPTPALTPNPEFLVEANRAKAEMLAKVWVPSLTRCRALTQTFTLRSIRRRTKQAQVHAPRACRARQGSPVAQAACRRSPLSGGATMQVTRFDGAAVAGK